jgi:monoamine oxidase
MLGLRRHEWRTVTGGAHTYVQALRGSLRSVDLRLPVRGLRRDDEGVLVRTATGELAADAVVVAVPAPVIGEIRFDPVLPAPLRDAIASVRYAHAAKLFVPLRERPATSAVLSVPERYWTWTARAAGEVQRVVHAFAGSQPALERLDVAAGPERWLESVARLRPDLPLEPDGAVLSTWADDPWARGAYSAHTPGGNDPALAAAYGRLVLAGEYTAGSQAALMEGALASGIRAAGQLTRATPSPSARPGGCCSGGAWPRG